MAAPSPLQFELRHVRGWGRVIAALSAQLAKSPQNEPLGETMLQACDKLRAAWQRARTLNAAEGR